MIGGSVLLGVLLSLLPMFFNTIEKRKGVVLNDWVLTNLPAHDLSVYIFSIIWGMAALAFYRAISKPSMYVTYVWTYSFIVLLRFVTISLIQLDPPVGLIQLTDPLTGIFYGHANITRDLFFSGQYRYLVPYLSYVGKKTDKLIGFLAIIAVGIMLLVQHVHYTLDVLMAPIAVYPMYKLAVVMLSNKSKEA